MSTIAGSFVCTCSNRSPHRQDPTKPDNPAIFALGDHLACYFNLSDSALHSTSVHHGLKSCWFQEFVSGSFLSSGNEEESNPWSNSCFGFFCKEYCQRAKSPVLPLQSSSLSFEHVLSSSWLPHTVAFQNKTEFPRQSGDAMPESYTAPRGVTVSEFVVLLTQSRNQELHLSSILSFIIVIVFFINARWSLIPSS